MSDFVPFFNTNKSSNIKDSYYITYRMKDHYNIGSIGFNGGMRDNLDLDKYTAVETLHDEKNKLIAVRFNNEPTSKTNRTLRKNGSGKFVSSVSFTKLAVEKYGYPIGKSYPYEILDNDIVVLLKEETTQERDK